MGEGLFPQQERRSLNRGRFTSITEFNREIQRFVKPHNQELAKPYRWAKYAATITTIIGAAEGAKKVSSNWQNGPLDPRMLKMLCCSALSC